MVWKTGPEARVWKGDNVTYEAKHMWVRAHLPKPEYCPRCGKVAKLEVSNNSGTYKRELSDWEWICRRCHMLKDGFGKNLEKGRGKDVQRIFSEEGRRKIRLTHLGKKRSEETRKKMSEAAKGRIKSPEHRRKIAETLKARNAKLKETFGAEA